jgi:hypothetical protein
VDSFVNGDAHEPSVSQDNIKVDASLTMQELPDISQLDIKNSVSSVKSHDEFDFFQDMEPVISKPHILHIDKQGRDGSGAIEISSKHCFDVNYNAGESEGEGWGDDLEDWGDTSESNTINT